MPVHKSNSRICQPWVCQRYDSVAQAAAELPGKDIEDIWGITSVRNPAFQYRRWRDRTTPQKVAKPRRTRQRMALTRRKKFGPMRCGMKRTAMISVVNQVIRPAVAIRIP